MSGFEYLEKRHGVMPSPVNEARRLDPEEQLIAPGRKLSKRAGMHLLVVFGNPGVLRCQGMAEALRSPLDGKRTATQRYPGISIDLAGLRGVGVSLKKDRSIEEDDGHHPNRRVSTTRGCQGQIFLQIRQAMKETLKLRGGFRGKGREAPAMPAIPATPTPKPRSYTVGPFHASGVRIIW